jgi:hypothetical protein
MGKGNAMSAQPKFEFLEFIYHPSKVTEKDFTTLVNQGWRKLRAVRTRNEDGTVTLIYVREKTQQ